MPTTVTIDSVTTEDAQPTVAPHKISALGAWDDVAVQFTATHDGDIVPTNDALPSEGTIYPDEGWFPDDPLMVADRGAMIPGVPRDTIGYIVRVGGSGPSSGRLVEQRANRCSVNRVCSSDPAKAAVSSYGTRVAPGAPVVRGYTYAQVNDGAGDGARTVNVYVLTESQGWS